MSKRFNLAVYPANSIDATSFYRCLGPLTELGKRRPELNVSIFDVTNWVTIASSDAVFLQRPYNTSALEVCIYAAKQGLPIWLDFDDDLWNIPSDNGAADTYAGSEQTVDNMLALADVVTVSTDALAKLVQPKTRAWIKTIPNALMTNIVGHVPRHDEKPRTPQIVWRGGASHVRDLDSVSDQLIEIGQRPRYEKIAWSFLGVSRASYRILEAIPNARRVRGFDPVDYFGALRAMRPRAVIVPLADNDFNRSKSNIGYIEATYAGALTIAPNWPEWRQPGVLLYEPRKPESFGESLVEALEMDDKALDRLWQEARDHMHAKLTIDVTNNLRCSVLDRLDQLSSDRVWREKKRTSIERGA